MTTQQMDPYVSPQSAVEASDPAEYAEVKIFSFSGRIGRLRYLAYSMGMGLILSLFLAVMAAITVPIAESTGNEAASFIMGILMIILYVGALVISFAMVVRRVNDFDNSGWLSLLMLVPVVNIIFGFALMLVPGSKGRNSYGAPPPPNNGVVVFLASLLPIIALLGILAAIAIPAYQQYVEKAAIHQSR